MVSSIFDLCGTALQNLANGIRSRLCFPCFSLIGMQMEPAQERSVTDFVISPLFPSGHITGFRVFGIIGYVLDNLGFWIGRYQGDELVLSIIMLAFIYLFISGRVCDGY